MNLKSLLGLTRGQLLGLDPKDIQRILAEEEVLHIFGVMDGFWEYVDGNPHHAKLKSGRCSNGFFYSAIVLDHENLRLILAYQLASRFLRTGFRKPDVVFGIPKGAKKLGDDVANILGVRRGDMVKVDGRLVVESELKPGEGAVFVEDFCSSGTGFKEAEGVLLSAQPEVDILPIELAIMNRGGLKHIRTDRACYGISPLVSHRIDDFEPGPGTCPMCSVGSVPIKPKENDTNWALINAYTA